MRSGAVKRIAQAAALAVVAVAILTAALPLLASTQIVRDRIAGELSSLTGYRVSLGGAPEIRIWPNFGARLGAVSMSRWGAGEDAPILTIDALDADLSALAAIRGDVVFTAVELARPVLRLEAPEGDLEPPRSPGTGRLHQAIAAARRVIAENPAAPDLAALPADPLGTIAVNDGRVVALGPDGERDLVTSITGTMEWPALNRTANLSASGIWQGEAIAVEAGSAQPLVLIAGGTGPLTVDAKSKPASGSFSGKANLSSSAFVNGTARFQSPSLRRMLEWSRTKIAPGAAIGAITLDAAIVGDLARMKLENAQITLDGNPGRGVLELALGQGVPRLTGTLAFDRLDLRSFLTAFAPLAAGAHGFDRPIDLGFTDQIGIDLRLSASTANLGAITLSNVAAATQVKSGLAVFDITDAATLGGTLQTSLRFDRRPEGNQAELRMVARNIDTAALAQRTGIDRLMPLGRGDLTVNVKGHGDGWDKVIATADGSIAAVFGPGTIAGLDFAAFRTRSQKGGLFALSDVSAGSTAINGAELKATIEDGVAHLDATRLRIGTETLSIDGLVPWAGQGLALSGRIETAGEEPKTPGAPAFFVGGSWVSPYVWPVPTDRIWE